MKPRWMINQWTLRQETGGRLVAEGYANLPRNPDTGKREIEVCPALSQEQRDKLAKLASWCDLRATDLDADHRATVLGDTWREYATFLRNLATGAGE